MIAPTHLAARSENGRRRGSCPAGNRKSAQHVALGCFLPPSAAALFRCETGRRKAVDEEQRTMNAPFQPTTAHPCLLPLVGIPRPFGEAAQQNAA
jgi:hypothetical protein